MRKSRAGGAVALVVAVGAYVSPTLADDLSEFEINNGVVTSGKINLSLPSIVLVHGWNYGCGSTCDLSYTNEAGPNQLSDITGALTTLGSEHGFNANIFLFNWRDAYTSRSFADDIFNNSSAQLKSAALAAPWAGTTLKQELLAQLEPTVGSEYTQNIQIIGYSLGTVVASAAAYSLAFGTDHLKVAQVTLLDTPDAVRFGGAPPPSIPVGSPFSKNDIYTFLPTGMVSLVDNYYSTQEFEGVTVGTTLPGAAPNGGQPLLISA